MVRIPEPEPEAVTPGPANMETGSDAETASPSLEAADHDEQLGEAIEAYLALAEAGTAPDPEVFVARYPDLADDLLAALEGLALVRGLVGEPDSGGTGGRLETGRRVAGYRIVRELGRGGMGEVWRAVDTSQDDRLVALKVLGPWMAGNEDFARRFRRESALASKLGSPHIVPIHRFGDVEGQLYIDMQLVHGVDLAALIERTGPLPPGCPDDPEMLPAGLREQVVAVFDEVGVEYRRSFPLAGEEGRRVWWLQANPDRFVRDNPGPARSEWKPTSRTPRTCTGLSKPPWRTSAGSTFSSATRVSKPARRCWRRAKPTSTRCWR